MGFGKMSSNQLVEILEIPDMPIIMPDGCRLSARVWMPVDAKSAPVPAILEFLPYRKRDGTTARDCLTHPYFAKRGYACIRVDMRGNGDSEGVMLDEYSKQELDDAEFTVNWLNLFNLTVNTKVLQNTFHKLPIRFIFINFLRRNFFIIFF